MLNIYLAPMAKCLQKTKLTKKKNKLIEQNAVNFNLILCI